MEMVHTRLGQHGIVLDLALAQGRAVVGDQDQLGLALPQSLQSCLVTQAVLATLHDQLQSRIDGVLGLGSLGLLFA